MEVEGKVAEQHGECGFYARVWVTLEPNAEERVGVVLGPEAEDRYQRQEGWLDAALLGTQIGMKSAKVSGNCCITRVVGMPVDTNSVLVAIAAIRAVWMASSFIPNEEQAARLAELILRSKKITVEQLRKELSV